MRARRAVAGLVVAFGAIAGAAPAHADDGDGAFIDADGDPTAKADDDQPGAGGSGAGSDDPCRWIVLVEDDFAWAIFDLDGNRRHSETGRWLSQDCPISAPRAVGGVLVVPEGAEVDIDALRTEALSSVPISEPPISTSPSADERLYTQVRTWLWLSDSWWQNYSATANAGRVSVSVTASPGRAEWDAGDGDGTTCGGPGVEWQRGMRDDATYCSYTYRHSSAGEEGDAYRLAVTVWFEVSWTSNTGAGGTLADISRSTSRQVQVGEVQAVETG
jgi:hypothetical protein